MRRLFRGEGNVAIATGANAGVWALDVDGPEGEAALRTLVRAHGPLPVTVESRTGGGGRHLLFRYPLDRKVRNTVRRLGPGLDTRSDGNGIIAPPSRHASGRAYEWAPGRSPSDVEPAAAPDWIYRVLETEDHRIAPVALGSPSPGSTSATTAYADVALNGEVLSVIRACEGTRNDTLHTAAVKLGGLVGAAMLDRRTVEVELTKAALASGLRPDEIEPTLRSGLNFGVANPRDIEGLQDAREAKRRAANHEAQQGRRKRLRDNPAALEWLTRELGLTPETIDHFGFGLDKPYESPKTGKIHVDALTFPLLSGDGTAVSLICKADVPGVTRHAKAPWWSAGKEDATFHAQPRTGQSTVLVCDMPDLWRLWQEMRQGGSLADYQLIASTGADSLPPEWEQASFWDAWSAIHVATSADVRGDRVAQRVHRAAGKPVHRLRPPSTIWRDAFASGTTHALFLEAVRGAVPMAESIQDEEATLGRLAYRPLDIGRAFHNGHLYYPVDTLLKEVEVDKDGVVTPVERVETVVVRSDGSLLHAVEMPAPKGTPLDKRVMRLSDGTLIDGIPKASANGSWSWPAIDGWIKARKAKKPVAHRPFRDIVEDVRGAFKRAVWLPYEEDYLVLALTCAASYCQAVFQAVPLLLLCGEAGSGKSTAGILTSMLSANGNIVGQVNAAAAARLIHETKGLIVLDDLESIGARAGKDNGSYSELIQWLKVSYNRDTATKVWVDAARNFKVERLNGFGIKVINNTTGSDSILGSRMLRIQTRKMPASQADSRRDVLPLPADEVQRLRDEMHAWTFDHVARIAEVYGEVCPSASERSEEIAAPLRVLARMSGDATHIGLLEAALARTKKASFNPEEPTEVLQEAATLLAQQGFREISPTHVILEMKRLVDSFFGQTNTTEIPEYQQPEWVGRMLRLRDILEPGEVGYRKRLWGKNLRVYPLSQNFLRDVLADEDAVAAKGATDFCMGCAACPYRSHACPLMDERLAVEKAASRRPSKH